MKKIIVSMVAILAVIAVVGTGSYAAWTSTKTSSGNTIITGKFGIEIGRYTYNTTTSTGTFTPFDLDNTSTVEVGAFHVAGTATDGVPVVAGVNSATTSGVVDLLFPGWGVSGDATNCSIYPTVCSQNGYVVIRKAVKNIGTTTLSNVTLKFDLDTAAMGATGGENTLLDEEVAGGDVTPNSGELCNNLKVLVRLVEANDLTTNTDDAGTTLFGTNWNNNAVAGTLTTLTGTTLNMGSFAPGEVKDIRVRYKVLPTADNTIMTDTCALKLTINPVM